MLREFYGCVSSYSLRYLVMQLKYVKDRVIVVKKTESFLVRIIALVG